MSASVFMADRLRAEHGVRSRITPLGVDTAEFSPAEDRGLVRRALGLPEDRFIIFTVRNLAPRMGLENLVEAAARVAENVPDSYFIIGGRGYLMPRLEGMIKERGLSSHVKLTGYIEEKELASYYQAADLFVLPTRELEGFGLVTLEALACGTPVLATPVAANIEVLGGFNRELLFESETPEAMAEGIESFARRDPAGLRSFRDKCRFFAEGYSWERYADEMEKIFYEVL
ncbi:MAG TPA: hypothetical protein DDW67_06025 [Elusimicrobia bacterium]|jgi:glycosyltransferase involved in cell wall biosynthesis|nr:hypothetical protein [Elusimicrobiota bacterium]